MKEVPPPLPSLNMQVWSRIKREKENLALLWYLKIVIHVFTVRAIYCIFLVFGGSKSQVKKGRAGIGGGKAGIGMGGGLLETQNGEEGLIVPPSIFDASTNEASFGNEEDGHMQEVLLPLLFDWNKKEGEKEAPPFALPLDRCIGTITSLLDRLLLTSSPPKLKFDEESETRIANDIDGGNEMSLVSTNFLSSDVLLQKNKDAAWKVIVACVAALIVEDGEIK